MKSFIHLVTTFLGNTPHGCPPKNNSSTKAPAPLEGLEGFLHREEHQLGFDFLRSVGENSRLTFCCGKASAVDIRMRSLKLKRGKQQICSVILYQHYKTDLNILLKPV